jgi:SAM-dependent methyltransferase
MIAASPAVGEVLGLDPSPVLIEQARELSATMPNVTFDVAAGGQLPLPAASFDAAVIHRVLSHARTPEGLPAEAFRVLRPGGRLAVCDGDYATITLATGEHDPLQVCVAAMVSAFVNDPWVVRRLTAMVDAAGFDHTGLHSHGFVQISDANYMLGIADRGADALAASGRIGTELSDALMAEAPAASPRRHVLRPHRLRQPGRRQARLSPARWPAPSSTPRPAERLTACPSPSRRCPVTQVDDGGHPELVLAGRSSVMSATQQRFGRSAVSTRRRWSAAGAMSGRPRRRVCAPTKACSRMIRATRRRDTVMPRRRVSWPHTSGHPSVRRDSRHA